MMDLLSPEEVVRHSDKIVEGLGEMMQIAAVNAHRGVVNIDIREDFVRAQEKVAASLTAHHMDLRARIDLATSVPEDERTS